MWANRLIGLLSNTEWRGAIIGFEGVQITPHVWACPSLSPEYLCISWPGWAVGSSGLRFLLTVGAESGWRNLHWASCSCGMQARGWVISGHWCVNSTEYVYTHTVHKYVEMFDVHEYPRYVPPIHLANIITGIPAYSQHTVDLNTPPKMK